MFLFVYGGDFINAAIKTSKLSFYNELGILTFNAKQFDTGRIFVFYIMDNDEPYDIRGCKTYIRIQKADGTQFQSNVCCKIDGINSIIVDTSIGNRNQILAASGINQCELHLEDDKGLCLTTWTFNIYVEKRVHNAENLSSHDSFDVIDNIVAAEKDRIESEKIRKQNEEQRIINESQRIDEENLRRSNENTRKNNEVNRENNENQRIDEENLRNQAEQTRNNNENTRILHEDLRIDDETQRKAEEKIRQDNENDRKKTFNTVLSQAQTYATSASISAYNAKDSAKIAKLNADIAIDNNISLTAYATSAENYMETAKSYAIGTNNVTRPNDNKDNSKFYSELARQLTDKAQKLLEQAQKIIAAASSGALIPSGTVTFENLPTEPQIGYMYNISNDFTTDNHFIEGAGIFYRAGANVYWTKDNRWDIMVGVQVTGVKGEAESIYHTGNVNITKANVGLGSVNNTSDKDKPISTAQQTALNNKISKTGDTMTGVFTLLGNQYTDALRAGGMNANNSNIYAINSLIFRDLSESATEGIQFYRDDSHADTLYGKNGVLYWTLNRAFGTHGTDRIVLTSENYASYALPKAGGTTTGNLTSPTFTANTPMTLTKGLVDGLGNGTTKVFSNGIAISNPTIRSDLGFIRVTGTGESDTVLEIATGDDGGVGERIVARQYNTSNAVAHELVLLGNSGQTEFNQYIKVNTPNGTDGEVRIFRNGSQKMYLGVGSGNINHGIWDNVLNKWMVYSDNSNTYLNGTAQSSNTIMMLNQNETKIQGRFHNDILRNSPFTIMGWDNDGDIHGYASSNLIVRRASEALEDINNNRIDKFYAKSTRLFEYFGKNGLDKLLTSGTLYNIFSTNLSLPAANKVANCVVSVNIGLYLFRNSTSAAVTNKYMEITLDVTDSNNNEIYYQTFNALMPNTGVLGRVHTISYSFPIPTIAQGVLTFAISIMQKTGSSMYLSESKSYLYANAFL